MVELRLIDGTRLELRGDEVIALTYAVNDIGSIETRQGVSSNEFGLPDTDFNRQALGFPTDFNVNQNVNPFTKIEAELYEEELRIAKGYIQITNPSLSGSNIPVVFFGENSEWFNLLKGKSIRELDLSEFNHTFQPSTIAASFANTEGYKYSLIDRNGLNFLTGDALSSQCFTINVFQSSIAKAIIEGIGYKIKGSLLDNPLYKKILISDTNVRFFALNEDSDIVRNANVATLNTTYSSGVETTIDFGSAVVAPFVSNPGSNFDFGTDTYTCDSAMLLNLFAVFNVFNATGSATDVTIDVKINTIVEYTLTQSVPAASSLTFLFDEDITLNAADTIELTITPATQDVSIGTRALANNFSTEVNFLQITVENEAIEGSVININSVLPDIDQADFIKDMVFDQNVLITANLATKEITFDLKNYNVNNFNDWSEIIDLSKEVEINYTTLTQKYANVNDVKRAEDDGIFIEQYNGRNNINFGDGVFTIDNDFIDRRETLFESKFASTKTINSLNLNQPLPYIYGEDISDDISVVNFSADDIEIGIDNNIEEFTRDVASNTIWALVTDSSNSDYNRAYSIKRIVRDPNNDLIDVFVNFDFTANATGVLRLVKRDEEAEPRKLIDGGNFTFEELGNVNTSYDITSVLDAPEDSETITEIPYLYFFNQSLSLPTDSLIDSLSYGTVNIPSLCSNLIEQYYPETIRLIQSGKVLKASFRLNQIDIFNLDFSKLVYLNFYLRGQTIQGYFIVNKIEEYTGQEDSTVVELIKY